MPVTPAEALACLAHVRGQYFERYDPETGPLHALLAADLFDRARKDYEDAVAEDRPYRPTPTWRKEVIASLRERRAFSEDSFRGKDKPQRHVATALAHLAAYETPDGRHLYVEGPEHEHRGRVELYFTVIEGAPRPRPDDAPASPLEEHEARVQRIAALIAGWIAKQLLRRSPADVQRLERYAKNRGVGYALAAFFGFVACAGAVATYRLSLHDVTVLGVQCVVDPRPNGEEPRATYSVMWERGSRPIEDYFVLRDGEDVTGREQITVYPLGGRDICVFLDRKPRSPRDAYYRVGYGRGIGRKVSAPIPTDHARCDDLVARVRAGVPLHARTLDAASVGAFLTEATTVSVGTPVSFYFPFVRKETVGAQIDPRNVGELLQSQRVVLDFGDGTRATQPANAIQHTFHQPGRYTVTAHDPSRTSDQQFTTVVDVVPKPALRSGGEVRPTDLCHGEGPNCHTLPLADIPATALPYAVADISNAPTLAARRGDEISFVLSFEGVDAPAQFGLGSTLVSVFGDGSKSIAHYDTLRDPGYPMEQHRWTEAGTFALRSCLVRRTESGPRYACAFAIVQVQ